MTKIASICACLLLASTLVVGGPAEAGPGGLSIEPLHQSLTVKIKKKKKKQGGGTGLTDCKIQDGGGGGCKGGFKYVCEKLEGGKKCCGCVADPNAKPAVQRVCCTGTYPNGVSTGGDGTDCGTSEAVIRQSLLKRTLNRMPVKPDSISCAPEK